jgi:hypothetical protein
MRAAKRLAAVCGSVATGVLLLSVVHRTTAIAALTDSPWLLAALLGAATRQRLRYGWPSSPNRASGSTGLTTCRSKPASRPRLRASSDP